MKRVVVLETIDDLISAASNAPQEEGHDSPRFPPDATVSLHKASGKFQGGQSLEIELRAEGFILSAELKQKGVALIEQLFETAGLPIKTIDLE